MRGGLYFVFAVSAIFSLTGLGLSAAWFAADPRFLLGDTGAPPDPAEFDRVELELRDGIATDDRAIRQLKENLFDLPADSPAVQRSAYETRVKDAEARREKSSEMLSLVESSLADARDRYAARVHNARESTLIRGLFLVFIGVVGMVRFREALTGASVA